MIKRGMSAQGMWVTVLISIVVLIMLFQIFGGLFPK